MNKKATKGYYTKLSNQKKLEKYGALLDIPHCKPSASLYLDILLDNHFAAIEKKEAKAKPKDEVVDKVIAGYIPCTDGTYEVEQSSVDVWAQAYPDIDIGAELNKVPAWLDSNPKKTLGGCKKFLNRWLNKAQNDVKPTGGNKHFTGKTSGNLSACEEFINE